ncbi:hypothetical protein [Natronobacterium texcoconense]|nr:hypothetical protein [Natronobacterium texcoconense]
MGTTTASTRHLQKTPTPATVGSVALVPFSRDNLLSGTDLPIAWPHPD